MITSISRDWQAWGTHPVIASSSIMPLTTEIEALAKREITERFSLGEVGIFG